MTKKERQIRRAKAREYRRCVEELHHQAMGILGLVVNHVPNRYNPGSQFIRAGGSQLDNPILKALAGQIDQVLAAYGRLQQCLGLDARDARFHDFLYGAGYRRSLRAETPIDPGDHDNASAPD